MTLVRTEEGIQDEQLNMESFPLAAASGGASNFSCAWTGVYNMYNPADRMHVLCRRGFGMLIKLVEAWSIPSKFDIKGPFSGENRPDQSKSLCISNSHSMSTL